mmetsp:Transcript_21302/g.37712  ORF Transcript_21302/g.37712 Transcript_21302/m.37712 type:complete len:142 (-) Transcript_21302:869-1294(-)
MALALVIVGDAELVFEARLSGAFEEQAHVHQFIMHSALDLVSEKAMASSDMFLGVIDEFNEFLVHAWLAADGARFLLLHKKPEPEVGRKNRSQDSIASFFEGVNELYTKVALNPFYKVDQKITSPSFARRVAALAEKWKLK